MPGMLFFLAIIRYANVIPTFIVPMCIHLCPKLSVISIIWVCVCVYNVYTNAIFGVEEKNHTQFISNRSIPKLIALIRIFSHSISSARLLNLFAAEQWATERKFTERIAFKNVYTQLLCIAFSMHSFYFW